MSLEKKWSSTLNRKNEKIIGDKTPIKLLKSPAIMASGFSNTIISASYHDELCDRLTLLLQKKYASKNSDMIDEQIIAIVDKLLGNKCMSKKQPKQILIKCNVIPE